MAISGSAALQRNVGKIDTDASGLARFSLKLEVPPGIVDGNEPELSLQYSQGYPNGSVGLGWALGGLSCIRKSPSNLAYDGANTPPTDYNVWQEKLTLDGAELLNVNGAPGTYGTDAAAYTTEIDNLGQTVKPITADPGKGGFLLTDSMGRRTEYGTTSEGRVLGGSGEVREWRLQRQLDCHGNAVSYHYVASPLAPGSNKDVNTSYLSEIRYAGTDSIYRVVKFEYSSRPDLVVQTVQSNTTTWGSLLSAIRFGVVRGGQMRVDRSYQLSYSNSTRTGASLLASVVECSGTGSNTTSLLPSTFGYTGSAISPQSLFRPGSALTLKNAPGAVELFTANISGRSLADVACLLWDKDSKKLKVNTYPAIRNADGTIGWDVSGNNPADLPPMDLSTGFPSILTADLNGDGRSDLLLPYRNVNGKLSFAVSQSTGNGFGKCQDVATSVPYEKDAVYMAIDLTGRGTTDIVQIFANTSNELVLRSFSGSSSGGSITFGDAKPCITSDPAGGTIQWVQISRAKSGAKDLVRVWSQLQNYTVNIKITTFTAKDPQDPLSGFVEGKTAVLETVNDSQTKYSVLPCDINGDGVQDIILASAAAVPGDNSGLKIALNYHIFLGDGSGGFTKYQNLSKQATLSAKMQNLSQGQFYLTNLDGSLYPSLSFVCQDQNGAYQCISVDGRSDGMVGDAITYPVSGPAPFPKPQIIPTDLNGTGMGAWLLYSIDSNTVPQVLPISNTATPTDLLQWAQDPMGLRSTVTYGTMSDPNVYNSTENWTTYQNTCPDGYRVLGSPNNVVTMLEHHNDATINSLGYKVTIKKSYSAAHINTRGRGWQGFGQIQTVNVEEGITTIESYAQSFPLTGMKQRIDTKGPDGILLRSEQANYQSASTLRGPWKIYRTNKTLEQTDYLDGGDVVRSYGASYDYDEHGNVITKSPFENQHGKPMHRSWVRCTYMTVNDITGVLVSKKHSEVDTNLDPKNFQPSDISLTTYTYDARPTLTKSSVWSSDLNMFVDTLHVFDQYGHETQRVDPVGLRRTVTYDDDLKTFPLTVTHTIPGKTGTPAVSDVSVIEQHAFDEASGKEVAKLDSEGLLTCTRVDGFGRSIEVRLKSASSGGSTVKATAFLDHPSVASGEFLKLLDSCFLDPYRTLSFEKLENPSYMVVKAVSFAKDGDEGQDEMTEVIDCVDRVRKRGRRQAGDSEKSWVGWEYNSLGQPIFQSFPSKSTAGPEWTATPSLGVQSSYDALGRLITETRPAHGDQKYLISSSKTYLDGGATIVEKTLRKDGSSLTELSSRTQQYTNIGGKELVLRSTNENKLQTIYQYNMLGDLTQCTDPAGQIETRKYNSRGSIDSVSDPYQNTVKYSYDAANRPIQQINAIGESIKHQRDALGRVIQSTGSCGRTSVYDYAYHDGLTNLSSVTTYSHGVQTPFESQIVFAYDHRGRVREQTLNLSDATTYTTTTDYDWQGDVIQEIRPDGVILSNEYHGTTMYSSTLSGGSASTWYMKATIPEYSAFEKPQELQVSGTEIDTTFEETWKYDSQGFPMQHTLSCKNTLVDDYYVYNELDQITRKHEFVTGATTDYTYSGKRLASSQAANQPAKSFMYDAAGNLLQKDQTKIEYKSSKIASATSNGSSVFNVTYDGAGRMTQRVTAQASTSFEYDSFGALRRIGNTTSAIDIISKYNGHTLQRKYSDGSSEIYLSDDYSIYTEPQGARTVRHKLSCGGYLVATATNTYESAQSMRPLEGQRTMNVPFTDTKGTVTHNYLGNGTLRDLVEYDEYGLITSQSEINLTSTYEGKALEKNTGLLDFGGRWYDSLVGRFITPDNLLDPGLLMGTDGMNRYAFENNDPINHVDPSGHWSWSAIVGIVVSVAMIGAAVAVFAATGGAAAVAAAAVVGALSNGGVAGIVYSIEHKDESDARKFWGGWLDTVELNAAVGAATGAFGAVASSAKVISGATAFCRTMEWSASATTLKVVGTLASIGGKMLISGAANVVTAVGDRTIENTFYDTHKNVWAGLGHSFVSGVESELASSAASKGFGGLKALGKAAPEVEKAKPLWKETLKETGKYALKTSNKTGFTTDVEHAFVDGIPKYGLYHLDEH